jgi:hypothetical protein
MSELALFIPLALFCGICFGIPSSEHVCPSCFHSGKHEKMISEVHYYQIAGQFDKEK